MSSSDESLILMLHAPDGADWAKFLAARLSSPSYGINSNFADISAIQSPTPKPSSRSDQTQSHSSSSYVEEIIYCNDPENELVSDVFLGTENDGGKTLSTDTNYNQRSSSIHSPKDRDGDHLKSTSHRVAKETISNVLEDGGPIKNSDKVVGKESNNEEREKLPNKGYKSGIAQSICDSRVTVLFISPDVIESEDLLCIDTSLLLHRRTVFLLLGVDLPDLMQYCGSMYDHVSKCRCSFIDGTEETICGGIVSIIEAFEDEGEDGDDEDKESVYNVPGFPTQMNSIEKVFPKMLTETERTVYLLLSRRPESSLQAVIRDYPESIPLVLVSERLYSFTLPADMFGEITFQLECQDRCFGEETIQAYSKLDLVHNILASELNPYSLIATSLGMDKDDVGGVDTALAFKLQELAPVTTFKSLCPCEEALKNSSFEEKSDKMWPTILHFAADFNLRLLCSELLRYPGMVAAACALNKDGEFPCQIAARKGFFQLENDLIQFMKKLQREVDPDYVSSSQLTISSDGGSVTTLSDINAPETADQVEENTTIYWDMTEVQRSRAPFLDVIPNSASTINRCHTPVRSQSDLSDNGRESVAITRRPLPRRPDSLIDNEPEETYSSPNDSVHSSPSNQGSPASIKALKRLGATQEEVNLRFSVLDPHVEGKGPTFYSNSSIGSLRTKLFSENDDWDNQSYSSNFDERDSIHGRSSADPRPIQVKEKVKGFFQRLKGTKKPGYNDFGTKKPTGIKDRRRSEPASSIRSNAKRHFKKKESFSMDEERDSGSYSDEEKKPGVFKESNKPWTRRVSKRIEIAKKESYSTDAPQLPIAETKKTTFKSFIK